MSSEYSKQNKDDSSVRDVYPWAEVTKNKLLPNGTKEEILNLLGYEPNTITQIAGQLGLSAPSVHTPITEMARSKLLREPVDWEKTHPTEKDYEPNSPVFKAEECAEFRREHRGRTENQEMVPASSWIITLICYLFSKSLSRISASKKSQRLATRHNSRHVQQRKLFKTSC